MRARAGRAALAALAGVAIAGPGSAAAAPDTTAVAAVPDTAGVPGVATVEVRDGTVVYVRWGEPGGVTVRTRVGDVTAPAPQRATPAPPPAAAPPAAAAPSVADRVAWEEALRALVREEVDTWLATPETAATRVVSPGTAPAPLPPSGTGRNLLDAPVGRGMDETVAPFRPLVPPRAAPGTAVVGLGATPSATPDTSAPAAGDTLAAAVAPADTALVVEPDAPPVPTTVEEVLPTLLAERDLEPRVIRERILDTGLLRTNLILFETSKSDLLPNSRDVIRTIGGVLGEFPDARIRIEGHADRRGPEAYNLELSQRRANAVRDFLLDCCAIAPERIEAVGYGETRPLVTGTSATELALNRRVEFRVLNPDALRVPVQEAPAE